MLKSNRCNQSFDQLKIGHNIMTMKEQCQDQLKIGHGIGLDIAGNVWTRLVKRHGVLIKQINQLMSHILEFVFSLRNPIHLCV